MKRSQAIALNVVVGLILQTAVVLAASPALISEEWALPGDPGELAGTLLLPEGEGPWPVTLVLAGEGLIDRDGNSTQFPGGNDCLRQLAEALAQNGVASLRVDKRGVGASSTAGISEFERRFDHFVADAAAWCAKLQSDPRFSSLTVVGHGQGSQVGMNAAWRQGADGFVSLNGPGKRFFDQMRDQLGTSLPVRTRVKAEAVVQELEREKLVPEPPVELTILFRPSAQEFMISWNLHDPLVELARLPAPLLVVQGSTDNRVLVADAEALAATHPQAELLIVEGMNHVMKMVGADNNYLQQFSLVDSTLTLAPEVPEAVERLVREADRRAAERGAARQLIQERAESGQRLMTLAREDSLLRVEAGQPIAEKVGRWARRFARDPKVRYLFGPKDGGYVAEGAVAWDHQQDCVSLLYRVSELARARDSRDAVDWALRTRFQGAGPDAVSDGDGRLDYDHPAHLDFSLDMIRTGIWGRDVTGLFAGATDDTVGSTRYEAGSFSYVPKGELVAAEFLEGDIVWFVLDPEHESAAALRQKYGLVIGHIGIVVVEAGQPQLIHAASSDLEGEYKGGTVVTVPLLTYLQRVERFAGVVVTRF